MIPTRRQFLTLSAASAALGLAACSGSGSASPGASSPKGGTGGPATLEFWAWAAGLDRVVERFNESQSEIRVRLSAGTSGAEAYQKLESAVKTGTGPDLAQVEYMAIPAMAIAGVLQDVAEVAEPYAQNYPESAWQGAGFLGQQYGVPNDQGPLVMYTNRALLDKIAADAPTTWAEYRETAAQLKADTGAYLGTLFADGAGVIALAAQNGAKWFDATADKWIIRINDERTRQVLDFWLDMARKDLVNFDPGFNAGFWQMLDSESVATYTVGAWGYRGMKGNLNATAGSWHVAAVPQWDPAEPRNGTWGGSTWSVTANCERPDAALKFADWLASDPEAMNLQYDNSGYYPANGDTASIEGYDEPDEFFGGQEVGPQFNDAAELLGTEWQWGPSITTLISLIEDRLGAAIAAGSSEQMLEEIQEEFVSRLRANGLEVEAE